MQRSHGQRIGYLSRMALRYFKKKFAGMNISPGQIFVLKYLFHHDGIHQEKLVEKCQIHKANVTRVLVGLESADLVYRVSDPADKRANLLYLTDNGHSIRDEFFTIFRSWTELLTQGFSDEEKQLSYEFLSRMAENVKNFDEIC